MATSNIVNFIISDLKCFVLNQIRGVGIISCIEFMSLAKWISKNASWVFGSNHFQRWKREIVIENLRAQWIKQADLEFDIWMWPGNGSRFELHGTVFKFWKHFSGTAVKSQQLYVQNSTQNDYLWYSFSLGKWSRADVLSPSFNGFSVEKNLQYSWKILSFGCLHLLFILFNTMFAINSCPKKLVPKLEYASIRFNEISAGGFFMANFKFNWFDDWYDEMSFLNFLIFTGEILLSNVALIWEWDETKRFCSSENWWLLDWMRGFRSSIESSKLW